MASISSNEADVRSIMTIMLKIRGMTVRTKRGNKFGYIEFIVFAVNTFFKIIRKNNIRIFNIEIKFNTIIKKGHSKNS